MVMNRKMLAAWLLASLLPATLRGGTRGSDELFWCPTFDQALEMSAHTGKPIFLMFYTNVAGGCPTFNGKGVVLWPGFAHEEARAVSHDAIRSRLANFVCVRLGWEAMEQAKRRHGLLGTTQGNQVLLDPKGKYIEGIGPRGQRYKIDELAAHLDRVHNEYPGHEDRRGEIHLDWFYVDRFAASAKGQLSGSFVSQVDRKPLAIVEGEEAVPLKDAEFLRRHVRQFVWERGKTDGPPRIVVRQFAPTRTDLATIDLAGVAAAKVSEQLDAAWLSYMKERPMVARGYIDNPHGNWLRDVMEGVHLEEVQVRAAAEAGKLAPPGRN